MGNRAVIAHIERQASKSSCVYVHWNGGRASVEGFLRAAQLLHIPAQNMGELHTVIEGFLGSSVYLDPFGEADVDNGDNGLYLIDDEWNIVKREYPPSTEETDPVKTREITIDCIATYNLWGC